MKKLIALFAFVATLSFVACNGGGESNDADQAAKDSIEAQRIADSTAAAEQAKADSIAAAEAAAMADTNTTDSAMMEEGHEGHEGEGHEESTH